MPFLQIRSKIHVILKGSETKKKKRGSALLVIEGIVTEIETIFR